MDFRHVIGILRSRAWVAGVLMLVAAAAAYVVSGTLPKVYEARSTVLVGQALSSAAPDYNQLLASQRLSQTYADLAMTRSVAEAVRQELRLDMTADELLDKVTADAPRDSLFVLLTAHDGDPRVAARIANAFAAQIIERSPQVVITTPDNPATNLLTLVDAAIPPLEPAGPRVLLNTALAALIGLLIGLAVIVFVEYIDDTVKTPRDVEELAQVPTLGLISQMRTPAPEVHRLAALLYPRSQAAEAFRALRTNVEFASVDREVRSLLITSSVAREGKTVVASNIALMFAQAGTRTLLVDADLRMPAVDTIFSLQNTAGLTTLLRGEASTVSSVTRTTDEPNLRVITSGPLPPNPAELLGSGRMRTLLETLATEAEMVIFDSPPLIAVTDAAVLARQLDGTIVVVRAGKTRRSVLRSGIEALRRVNAPVLGVTINGLPELGPAYEYDDGRLAAARGSTTS
jgi:capsular exopolysaccharide synthesis family protein